MPELLVQSLMLDKENLKMKAGLLLFRPSTIWGVVWFVDDFSTHACGTSTGAGKNFNAVEGASFNGVTATFTDTTSTDLVTDFIATVNWGDGTVSSGFVSEVSTGAFNVGGSHTYAEEAAYTVTTTLHLIRDNSNHVASSGTATVADAPLFAGAASPVNCTEGSLCNLTVTFTDADPNGIVSDYAATINWGDGTMTVGTIVVYGTCGFIVVGSHG